MNNEAQLIKDLKQGCPEAMGGLYALYFDKVFLRCLSITKDESDAYDCANDAMLISFEKIDSFKGNASYATWLFAIASNYSISYCKKRSRELSGANNGDEHFIWPTDFDLTPMIGIEELIKLVLEAIPVRDKELLLEKYANSKSIEELKQQFGLGESAIKMRLCRAKKKVNELFLVQFSQIA